MFLPGDLVQILQCDITEGTAEVMLDTTGLNSISKALQAEITFPYYIGNLVKGHRSKRTRSNAELTYLW